MNISRKQIKYFILSCFIFSFCHRYLSPKKAIGFNKALSNIEVSRETRYNYFTNIESETTFKNNLSTEYNNTTISAVLKVNNFEKRKYHYSLENLEIKSSLLNSNEEQGCIKSLEEGFTVEKRMANLLDKLAYPAISSEHCINLIKLIYSEIQLSLPNESVTSWQSFEYGFGAPILARYNSYFGGKDKIIIEKTRKYFLEEVKLIQSRCRSTITIL